MDSRIMWGIVFGAMAIGGISSEEGICTYRVGRFEVSALLERQGRGNPSILVNAPPAQVQRYIPEGSYPMGTNTFLIKGGGRNILVDTGFGEAVFDHLKELGVAPEQIDAVLLTHMHGDHIGGLQKGGKALFPKADVYLALQEKDFWLKDNDNKQAASALAPYGSRVKTFLPEDIGKIQGSGQAALFPGIIPIAAFGHTPGHTAFMVESEGQRFIIWGDLMHAQLIQFPVPDVSVSYDTDPVAAAVSRKAILEYTAANKIPVGGMHLNFPAIGSVTKASSGYSFDPVKP
ncbi:MAG: MBL fold metallo-hydrolase [Treponema sp.]|nr:MBL fold metallo-hydrolase [Treponema sp.]